LPAEVPLGLATSVIGAPFDSTVPLAAAMFCEASRSMPRPVGSPTVTPELRVMTRATTPRLASGVTPPTAPLKVALPVLAAFRRKPPSSVLAKTSAPLPALSVVCAPTLTASLKVWPVVVVIEPPSMRVLPPAFVTRDDSADVAPTAPPKTVARSCSRSGPGRRRASRCCRRSAPRRRRRRWCCRRSPVRWRWRR
jgi:hypothetical protein